MLSREFFSDCLRFFGTALQPGNCSKKASTFNKLATLRLPKQAKCRGFYRSYDLNATVPLLSSYEQSLASSR